MNKQKTITIAFIIIAVVATAFGGYFYYKLRSLQNNPQVTVQKEKEDLLAQVGDLYLIPTGEDPTIATVSDPKVLQNQSFFANAQKGDKVLIFTKAGKAILYRPSINKIVEVAPISSGSDSTVSATPPSASTTPTTPASTSSKTTKK
jgi:hypothetical protein